MQQYSAIILAAGKGTRMNEGQASPIPKVMIEANGNPIIYWATKLIHDAGVQNVTLIVGYKKEIVQDYFKNEVSYAVQEEQLGTGHAVMQAKSILNNKSDAVIVFYGDHTLWKPETVKNLMALYEDKKPTIAMLSVVFEDPEFWAFGRIIKNEQGEVIGSIEQKDCTPEQLKIKECNPCFYIFKAAWLWENIENLSNNNAQKEYYLTDLIAMAIAQDKKVVALPVSEYHEAMGINTPEQLKQAEEVLRSRKV